MVIPASSLQSRQVVTTVHKPFLICFWWVPVPLVCRAVFAVITGVRICLLQHIWKKFEALSVDPTYGEGAFNLLPRITPSQSRLYRSVHNIRIERLWVDVTAGFGRKWKSFFQDLELYDGLDVELDTHIWLIHYLFLTEINADAREWAGAWNSHKLGMRDNRSCSPNEMFFFGMIQEGSRGFDTINDARPSEEDLTDYGIDWEALDDQQIRTHHDQANPVDPEIDDVSNPFQRVPERFPHVEVEEPWCPLSAVQIDFLDARLNWNGRNLPSYRLRWIAALDICTQFVDL
jgi:hypothetical protein